jgi:DNA-binding NtrC family response regulator
LLTPLGGANEGRESRMSESPCVLVAEDDADMRQLVCHGLRRAGFRVTAVADVMAALDQLAPRGARFDVVVSDVRMPGLSGLDLLALLRGARLELPVVIVSAFADEATRAEARELGAAAVLDKPVDVDVLSAVVARAVSRV